MSIKPELGSIGQGCLKDQLDIPAFGDFTVKVEDVSFQCHKVKLSACSEYFQALFRSQMKECQVNCVSLQGVTTDAFSIIMDAVYKGISGLNTENVIDVWHAAVQLQIAFMINECECFIKKSMAAQNCPDFYAHAKLLDSNEIIEFFFSFVRNNFELCRRENIFCQLPVVDIYKILQDDDLKADCEDSVVGVILGLIQYTEEGSTLLTQPDIVKLLSAVRICLVSRECLGKLFECDEIMTCRAARDIILTAINYRLSVELRHGSWPDAAVNRATSDMKHAMVFASGGTVIVYLLGDGSTHEYTTLPDSQLASLCVFNNLLHMHDCNTLQVYSGSKVWQTLVYTASDWEIPTRRTMLFSLGSYIYCFDAMNGNLQCYEHAAGCRRIWDVLLQNISYAESMIKCQNGILLFGTLNDTLNVLYVSLKKHGVSKVLSKQPITGPLDGMVSFTHGENVFILQKNGSLWKIDSHQHLRLDFQYICKLWGFTWQLYGSIIYKKQLFIFGSQDCPHKPVDFQWPTNLPGIIDTVKVIEIQSDTLCLPIVVNFSK